MIAQEIQELKGILERAWDEWGINKNDVDRADILFEQIQKKITDQFTSEKKAYDAVAQSLYISCQENGKIKRELEEAKKLLISADDFISTAVFAIILDANIARDLRKEIKDFLGIKSGE